MNTDTIYYTILGESTTKDDDGNYLVDNLSDCLAKKEKEKFYIRIDDSGRFSNPNNQLKNRHPKFRNKTMDENLQFAKVSAETFNHYLAFLRTNNKVYLSFAERSYV